MDEIQGLLDECKALSDDPMIDINDFAISSIIKRVGLFAKNQSPYAREQMKHCLFALRRIRDNFLYTMEVRNRTTSLFI